MTALAAIESNELEHVAGGVDWSETRRIAETHAHTGLKVGAWGGTAVGLAGGVPGAMLGFLLGGAAGVVGGGVFGLVKGMYETRNRA